MAKSKRKDISDMALSAAEFKRLHCNRAIKRKAEQAMRTRTVINADEVAPLTRDKQNLRDTWNRRNMDPKGFYKPNGEFNVMQGRNPMRHLVTQF